MVFVIAFCIIAAIVAIPAWWMIAFAHAMGGQQTAKHVVWQALLAITAIAFVGALIVSGIWSLIAPLFG